jgi:hypothetical protein
MRVDASEGRLATWADIAAGSQLDLELTESMIMDDVDENVSKLAASATCVRQIYNRAHS